jgi:hypothetical protein
MISDRACTGKVRSFEPRVGTQQAIGDSPIGVAVPGLSSFDRDSQGRIYLTQLGDPGRVTPSSGHPAEQQEHGRT